MHIALYSPYLPKHCGGGEKYLMDVAASLLGDGHEVTIGISQLEPVTPDQATNIREKYAEFIDRDLTHLEVVACPLNTNANFFQKLAWTTRFDVLYYQTDGSLFFSLAKKNILHIQVPLAISKTGWLERLKLLNWSIKNTNSDFTRQTIEQWWQVKIPFVHYPMIQMVLPPLTKAELPTIKKPIILHVGRFFRQLHCKRQDVLVQAFRELRVAHPVLTKDWQLVCIGSIEDQSYADEVHSAAAGLPVQFLHEINREELKKWYQKASIYWHATGYGLDEKTEPEKMEHFGISTVEAMSAGVAPVVINKGGQPEILTGELKPWLWQDSPELIEKTAHLIAQPDLLKEVQLMAQTRANAFGPDQFTKTLRVMLQ